MIVRRQKGVSTLTVAVEQPLRQRERGALVPLAEALRPSHPVREDGSCVDNVIDTRNRVERSLHSVKVVGLVEPLVRAPRGPVERDCQVERRPDQ